MTGSTDPPVEVTLTARCTRCMGDGHNVYFEQRRMKDSRGWCFRLRCRRCNATADLTGVDRVFGGRHHDGGVQ
jgi:hypothetical protein